MPDGVDVVIGPGDYPVKVSVADVSDEQDGSHMREAYLSLVIADGAAAWHAPMTPPGAVDPEPGMYVGVGVDAGTVAFVDQLAARTLMPAPRGDWQKTLFETGKPDSWFSQMDAGSPLPSGYANIVLPLARNGENIVLSHSGWGDGFYPVIGVRDARGALLSVHIDLQVIGEFTTSE